MLCGTQYSTQFFFVCWLSKSFEGHTSFHRKLDNSFLTLPFFYYIRGVFKLKKMATVKEEAEDFDDYWLSQWTNYDKDKIKLEDIKTETKINIKRETGGNDVKDCTKPKNAIKLLGKSKGKKRSISSTSQESMKIKNPKSHGQCTEPNLKKSLEQGKICDSVASMCQYQCKECDKVFINSKSLRHHFNKYKHGLAGRKNLYKYLVSIVAHKCHICSEKILCDKSIISYHLRNKHNMKSLKEYISTV